MIPQTRRLNLNLLWALWAHWRSEQASRSDEEGALRTLLVLGRVQPPRRPRAQRQQCKVTWRC
jgi:hypothetical protein